MPLVGSDNEPLTETANFVYNGTLWVPMEANADGHLKVTIPDPDDITAYMLGYVAGAWHRQPMLLGYSATVSEQIADLNAGAGGNAITGTAVPAGEIWEITAVSARNSNSATTRIFSYASVGGVTIVLNLGLLTPAAAYVVWTGKIVLEEGDTINAWFEGCTAGDDLYCYYAGIRTDIDL